MFIAFEAHRVAVRSNAAGAHTGYRRLHGVIFAVQFRRSGEGGISVKRSSKCREPVRISKGLTRLLDKVPD